MRICVEFRNLLHVCDIIYNIYDCNVCLSLCNAGSVYVLEPIAFTIVVLSVRRTKQRWLHSKAVIPEEPESRVRGTAEVEYWKIATVFHTNERISYANSTTLQ